MRKPWRIALTTVGIIVALPVLTLATTSTVHAVATSVEAGDIDSYGELVPVDGKRMNVLVSGTGPETIVLLPGLGTAAPALDFQPLISELDDSARVVAIEPFGTGLSDQTDAPRTAEHIAGEVHEALQQLGIDRYALMGHSISGIYALTYTAAYPDEVTAFIGIDSSVPDQPGSADPIPTSAIVTLANLGITRILAAVAGDPYAGLPYDDHAASQMALLSTRNTAAPTMIDEMDRMPANFAAVSGTTFAASLPVLLFVATRDTDVDGWLALHDAQAATVQRGEVVTVDGSHYLHHTRAAELARGALDFLAGVVAD